MRSITPSGNLSTSVLANGVVYSSAGQIVNGADATTGKSLWTFLTGGNVESSPAVANGVVYFESDDGYAYALDAGTGTQLWCAVAAVD